MMYPDLQILSKMFSQNLLKFTQPLNFIGNLIGSTFIAFQHFNWMHSNTSIDALNSKRNLKSSVDYVRSYQP